MVSLVVHESVCVLQKGEGAFGHPVGCVSPSAGAAGVGLFPCPPGVLQHPQSAG